jgi:hypothetical protein
MAGDRYPDVLQRLIIYLPEQIEIDIVGLKSASILGCPIPSSQLRISLTM